MVCPYWLAVRLSQVLAMPYTQTPSRVKVRSATIIRCRVRRSSLTEAAQRRYIRPIKLRNTPRLAAAGTSSQAGCTGLPALDRLLNQPMDTNRTARLENSRISRDLRRYPGVGRASVAWSGSRYLVEECRMAMVTGNGNSSDTPYETVTKMVEINF